MKIDKRNPLHWLLLGAFTGIVAVAILLRPFARKNPRQRVIFYGHKLAGNLLPTYRALEEHGSDFESCFLTMDLAYCWRLRSKGERAIFAISWPAVAWLASADAVISDHGLHAIRPMQALTDLKFFDAWHGIPFKGFDRDDFSVQRRFDEIWVASPFLAEIYAQRFGFSPLRVFATGYARTDILVDGKTDASEVRRELGIPPGAKVVLFAPTWRQDDPGRSGYPFGVSPEDFFNAMSDFAARHGAIFIVRDHLNQGARHQAMRPGIVDLPFSTYPWTERLLLVVDVLVCDWSSIAFDFLLLDRPAIFLDVPAPFAKGLTLDASWRYGQLAGSLEELLQALEASVADPSAFMAEHGTRMKELRDRLYGGMADGKSAERCVQRLTRSLRS